jgi:hypothetical protein
MGIGSPIFGIPFSIKMFLICSMQIAFRVDSCTILIGSKERVHEELNLVFLQLNSSGFEPCHIRLQVAIVAVFGNYQGLVALVELVVDLSEGGFGLVQLEKVGTDFSLVEHLDSDEPQL